jgi:3-methyladenine DNA glycosylase/8-oxoguanine DNA glycosylase
VSAPPYDRESAVAHLTARDPRLGELLARVGPCRLEVYPKHSPYEFLCESIAYQQLNGKAAATIFGRFCALFGRRSRAPRPEQVAGAAIERLRGAGLSQAKSRAILDLAEKTIAGVVPGRAVLGRLDDDAIVERLIAVRGIGRWTVEMFLIFGLGRPDVLPVDDFGVRKGFQRAFRKRQPPTPKQLAAWGERWRPYRSVASWYLWRAAEEPKGERKDA